MTNFDLDEKYGYKGFMIFSIFSKTLQGHSYFNFNVRSLRFIILEFLIAKKKGAPKKQPNQ